jgi:hypothetical protein
MSIDGYILLDLILTGYADPSTIVAIGLVSHRFHEISRGRIEAATIIKRDRIGQSRYDISTTTFENLRSEINVIWKKYSHDRVTKIYVYDYDVFPYDQVATLVKIGTWMTSIHVRNTKTQKDTPYLYEVRWRRHAPMGIAHLKGCTCTGENHNKA